MSRRSANTTKVFVGSLPAGTTVEELRNLFGAYGPIAECDVVNRCGFIHMEDRQLAFKAIDDLNNYNFKGSRISVEKGRVKPSSSIRSSGSSSSSNSGGPMRNSHQRDRHRDRDRDEFRGTAPTPYARNRNTHSMMMPRPPPYTYGNDRPYERRPLLDDRRTLGERNVMMDRRPLMDPPVSDVFDNRRPQPFDMLYNNNNNNNRKSMGGYNNSSYDYSPVEQQHQREFAGGPPLRRDMPPPRRY